MPLWGMQSKNSPTELTLQHLTYYIWLLKRKTCLQRTITIFFYGFFFGFVGFFCRFFFFWFFSFPFFAFSSFFTEFILHLFCRCVGADGLVLLVGDAGQPLLGSFLHLLDGYRAVKVGPEAEDVAGSLQLAHFKKDSISSSGQLEVEVKINLSSLKPRLLDLRDH